MKIYLSYSVIILGIFSVLYFSWIESPRFSLNGLLPKWITDWTDSKKNENFRTAIPFIFINTAIGLKLIYNRVLKTWLFYYSISIILVFMAELGQLFLPLRVFDWVDIFWGVIVSSFILCFFYMISSGLKTTKQL